MRKLTSEKKINTADYLAIVFIVVFLYCIKIGNSEMRMALSSSDDNPINNIRPLLDPDRFQIDALMVYNSKFAISSAFTLIPLFLTKIGITAGLIWNLLMIMQVILMFVSSRYLMRSITQDRLSVYIFWAFIIFCKPYFFNLAGISDLDYQPYAFWFALPLALFSLGSLIRGNNWFMALFCLLTYCLHPSTGVLLLGFLLIYFLAFKKRIEAINLSILAVIPVLSFTTFLYNFDGNTKTPDLILNGLKNNYHLIYWNPLTSPSPSFAIYVWALFLSLSFAVNSYYKGQANSEVLKLFNTFGIYVITCVVLQFVSTKLGFLPIMSLVPTRISAVFVILGFAIFISKVVSEIKAGNNSGILNLAICIYPSPYLLTIIGGEKFFERRTFQDVFKLIKSICLFLMFMTLTGYNNLEFFNGSSLWTSHLIDLTQFDIGTVIRSGLTTRPLMLTALFLLLIIFFTVKELGLFRSRAIFFRNIMLIFSGLLFLMVVTIGTQVQYQYSFQSNQFSKQKVSDLVQAQKWARENTGKQESFIVTPNGIQTPWRTLSERPVISPFYVAGLYGNNQKAARYTEKIMDYLDVHSGNLVAEENLCDFVSSFGGSYVVLDNSQAILEISPLFPVYKNSSYTIYRIKCLEE
jgi:hypothetical protein